MRRDAPGAHFISLTNVLWGCSDFCVENGLSKSGQKQGVLLGGYM